MRWTTLAVDGRDDGARRSVSASSRLLARPPCCRATRGWWTDATLVAEALIVVSDGATDDAVMFADAARCLRARDASIVGGNRRVPAFAEPMPREEFAIENDAWLRALAGRGAGTSSPSPPSPPCNVT